MKTRWKPRKDIDLIYRRLGRIIETRMVCIGRSFSIFNGVGERPSSDRHEEDPANDTQDKEEVYQFLLMVQGA